MAGASVFTDVTFTIEGVTYSCEVSRAEFVNSPKILNSTSLCGPTNAVGRGAWTLEIEGFQDWTSASTLSTYLAANEGVTATAEVVWTDTETPTLGSNGNGEVKIVAGNYGGTADEIATFAVSLPVDGTPVFTSGVLISS